MMPGAPSRKRTNPELQGPSYQLLELFLLLRYTILR